MRITNDQAQLFPTADGTGDVIAVKHDEQVNGSADKLESFRYDQDGGGANKWTGTLKTIEGLVVHKTS